MSLCLSGSVRFLVKELNCHENYRRLQQNSRSMKTGEQFNIN